MYEAHVVTRTHSRTFKNWFKWFQGCSCFSQTFPALRSWKTSRTSQGPAWKPSY